MCLCVRWAKARLRAGLLGLAARPVNGEGMDAAGQGRVWLDVTTTSHAGGRYTGTTRIERSLIRELPAVLGSRLGFCVYDRLLGRFLQVVPPALPDAGAAHRSAARKRRSGLSNAGRRIERTVRGLVKGAVART